jgi:uncharacterized protein YjiS (DUF1127 family)
MSITLSTIVRPARSSGPATFRRVFNAGCEAIARYFVCRAAIKTLRELDDRALRDIGLTRSQIDVAVRGFVTVPSRTEI